MAEIRKDPGEKELWKSFIDMHEDLELLESGKCRCRVTGHEMKPIKDVVEAHLNGKRYKKEKGKLAANKFDFEQFAPFIVQSKKDPRKLFCHLTKTHLNKVPEEVKLHVNGRRFKARKEEREELQAWKAQHKKKRLEGGGEEDEEGHDPLLDKFKGFDSGEEEDEGDEEDDDEDEDEDDDDEEDEEVPQKKKGRLLPAIGNVADDDNEDFEEVEAAASDEDEDEDEDEDGAAPKGKLPWPVPEFTMFGAGKKRKGAAATGDSGEAAGKKAKSGEEDAAQAGGEAEGGASKHHGRGKRAEGAGSKGGSKQGDRPGGGAPPKKGGKGPPFARSGASTGGGGKGGGKGGGGKQPNGKGSKKGVKGGRG